MRHADEEPDAVEAAARAADPRGDWLNAREFVTVATLVAVGVVTATRILVALVG